MRHSSFIGLSVLLLAGLLLSACGGGGSSVSANARTYYVDALVGDDGADGSSGSPLATITAGIDRLAVGDTLLIRGGDYRSEGTLVVRLKGSAGSPVVIASQSGGVRVDSVSIEESAWVELRGLTIVSGKPLPAGWPDMPAVLIDNADPAYAIDPAETWTTRAAKVAVRYSSYSTFVDPLGGNASWEHDLYSDGINVAASQQIVLTGNTIARHTTGINLRNGSSEIRVEGNAISYCLDGLRGDRRLIDSYSFRNSTIRGNHLWQTFREGIRLTLGARDNLVERNLVENTGHSHIATWQAGGGNTIRHNMLRQGGYYAETMRWPGPSGISVHSAGANSWVEGNAIALQVDATLNDGNGIIIDQNDGDAATLVNNLIYRVMGSGISSVDSGNARLLHNTIVESGYGTMAATNGMGLRFHDIADVANTIANNLIVDPANGGIWFRNGTLAGQSFIDNNLYDFSGLPLVTDGATSYATLPAWQATGHGLQALAVPALLEEPHNGLFGVQSGSLARLAGSTSHNPRLDLEGAARGDPPTIGAYEGVATAYAEPKRFLFGLHSDASGSQDFVVLARDLALVAELRAQLTLPEVSRGRFINGAIRRGGLGHNASWDWHFIPGGWSLTDSAIELCDGTPSMVEADLAYWVDRVGSFCPWGAFVKAEL